MSFRRTGLTQWLRRSSARCPSRTSATAIVNNFAQSGAFFKLQQIPSIKIDQNFGRQDQDFRILRHAEHGQIEWSGWHAGCSLTCSPSVHHQQNGARELRSNNHTDIAVSFRRRLHAPRKSGYGPAGQLRLRHRLSSESWARPARAIRASTASATAFWVDWRSRSVRATACSHRSETDGHCNVELGSGNHTYKTGVDWKIDTPDFGKHQRTCPGLRLQRRADIAAALRAGASKRNGHGFSLGQFPAGPV